MLEFARIADFLTTVEGKSTRIGYIPCNLKGKKGTANYRGGENPEEYDAMGSSGVTIGVGVDLGQQSMDGLRRMGVSAELRHKLEPYVGRKKDAAIAALHASPLKITQEEADALTLCEQAAYMQDVVLPEWRRNSILDFEFLPWQVQAVFFSLLYQCGAAGAKRRGPVTLAALYRGDWERASRALRDRNGWNGEYVSRRKAEGDLLAGIC